MGGADGTEAGLAGLDQLGLGKLHQFGKVVANAIQRGFNGGRPIAVRTSEGLGDDLIDQPELEEIGGGYAEGGRGLGREGAVFPKNAGTPFGGDNGIVGIFQNEDAIGHADAEGASTAALANDDGDDGDTKVKHFANIDGNGLGHVPFFTGDTGEGSRSVNEGDDGQAKAVGQAHESQGLTIAFGVRTAEVSQKIFFGVAPFLMAEKDNALLIERGQTPDEGSVFAKGAVAAKFEKFRSPLAKVIEQVGALRVAHDLNALPRGKVAIDIAPGIGPFLLEGGDFGFGPEFLFTRKFSEFFDPFFEVSQGLFEIEGSNRFGFDHLG